MKKTIACSVPYGSGGLGQHFTQIIEDARAQGELGGYLAGGIKPGDEALGRVVREPWSGYAMRYTPVRYSAGWKSHLSGDLFDRAVASTLRGPLESYIGFGGQSLHSFRKARSLGCHLLELQAANSHVHNVMRQHALALRRHGLERSWLNDIQCRKTLQEYALADEIIVASEYTRQSFLEAGVPEHKLRLMRLRVNPRFVPPTAPRQDDVFRVVYTGSVTVMKGVPVLIEAFSRLTGRDAELILVGGWASRGMRRYLQDWTARDPRIKIAPGDPLPHLHRASVYVHPSWEDGWAYAPAEALACGVPVVVTEDTGMKELVEEGVNGYVVPTGSWEAILHRLEYLRDQRTTRKMEDVSHTHAATR